MSRPHLSTKLFSFRKPGRGGTLAAARRKRLKALLGTGLGQRGTMQVDPARMGLAIGTVAALTLLLCIHLLPNRVTLRLGDVADRDIFAPRTVRYEDTAATRVLREDALSQVPRQYEIVPDAMGNSLDAIRATFDALDRAAPRLAPKNVPDPRTAAQRKPALTGASPTVPSIKPYTMEEALRDVASEVRRQSDVVLPRAQLSVLLRLDTAQRRIARQIAGETVERAMSRAITDEGDDLRFARESVAREERLRALPKREVREAVAAVAAVTLTATRRYDARKTERDREATRASIPPQIVRLTAGTVIVRAGQRVTQQHLDAFAALGLQSARMDAASVAVVTLLVVMLVTLGGVYLRLFHRRLYEDTSRLLLLSIVAVVSVLGLKIGSALLGLSFKGVHFGYLGMMSVASAGMVIALLISPRVATLIVALLSVASGLVLNNELRFMVITLASSLVGIVSVTTLKNRGDLLRAAVTLCGSNALINALVGQLQGDVPQELLAGLGWGVVSGLFALALFYVGMAALERLFGITTHLRLLELSDPATPILQQFRMRVPGTYAHSLMVGNLAHAAAEAIGADALLVRVAAYYHDIGKMNRPEFFIENQGGGENVHDRLSPTLSALVLISHVKEGLVMAEAVGLPPRVREVMEQHHGTTLIKYFYFRATGGIPDPNLEPQFRYPGPKPQTKEAAILMLADTVEAASRTLERPTTARIADFVARIVEDKRADGQLDECNLTLRDLKVIQDIFTRTLSGTLHARIEYPGQKREPEAGSGAVTSSGSLEALSGLAEGRTSNTVVAFCRVAGEPDLDDTADDLTAVRPPDGLSRASFATPLPGRRRGGAGDDAPVLPVLDALPSDRDSSDNVAGPNTLPPEVGARGSGRSKSSRSRRD